MAERYYDRFSRLLVDCGALGSRSNEQTLPEFLKTHEELPFTYYPDLVCVPTIGGARELVSQIESLSSRIAEPLIPCHHRTQGLHPSSTQLQRLDDIRGFIYEVDLRVTDNTHVYGYTTWFWFKTTSGDEQDEFAGCISENRAHVLTLGPSIQQTKSDPTALHYWKARHKHTPREFDANEFMSKVAELYTPKESA